MAGDQDLGQLLANLSTFISRFVTLSPAQADICALWVVHTHSLSAAGFTPYLDISSPVLRSGKTRLLEILKLLASKPWLTGRVSSAALVRKIAKEQPTLLLDESDTAFSSRDDYSEKLRGVLNTGFERGGSYSICVQSGNDWESKDFPTFSPKAIAGIGKLPPTIQDRAIPIRLKRALRDEKRERFRERKVKPEADRLRQRVCEWVNQNLATLSDSEPQLPEQLNDRQQDVCEPLVAIADCAGGEWPHRTRRGLTALYCSFVEQQDTSQSLTLLADIQTAFSHTTADRLSTQELLKELVRIETSPWSEADRGKPLSPFGLSRQLHPFGIRPKDIRFGDATRKGYFRVDFEDAWARYLPVESERGQQGQQASVYTPPSHFSGGQQMWRVAGVKDGKSSVITQVVADVATSTPPWDELGAVRNPRVSEKSKGRKASLDSSRE
jgi:hypothetical protein